MISQDLLVKNKIFNVDGDDSNKKLIGGNSTGIFNLNNIKYPWASQLKTLMINNFWIPQRVPMEDDKTEAPLSPDEEDAFRKTLSFLIYLDSIQVTNLPNLSEFITAPECQALFTVQAFQELIHTESYQYIQEGLYPSVTREEIYYMWRNDPLMLKRNKLIADRYSAFEDEKSLENYKQAIVANYALEGIYFYSGFSFFHNLAYNQKRKNTDSIIRFIKQDELTHVAMFANIINTGEVLDVKNNPADRELVVNMLREAGEQEIEWAKQIYGNRISGITDKSSEDHIKALVNERLGYIGLDPIYDVTHSPYAYLEDMTKQNFFEDTVTAYSRSETLDGWDAF